MSVKRKRQSIVSEDISSLEERAHQGDAEAQWGLACQILHSDGDRKDYYSWLMRAAVGGIPIAQDQWSRALQHGCDEIQPDKAEALLWMKRARDNVYCKGYTPHGYFLDTPALMDQDIETLTQEAKQEEEFKKRVSKENSQGAERETRCSA